MRVRSAEAAEHGALAALWQAGWYEAHAAIVPPELVRRRAPETFLERMGGMLPTVRALGPIGAPLGFHFIRGDELNQFYVAAEARGQGVAATLMADAEACLLEQGNDNPWLACAIGNDRAARFYEKSGWRRAGVVTDVLETPEGRFDLDIWRYEKALA